MRYTIKSDHLFDLNILKTNQLPWHMKIMLGGKFISQAERGIFSFLPAGTLVVNKIKQLLRKIFSDIGAYEIIFPMVQSNELWAKSGRGEKFSSSMAHASKDLILAPSHEEALFQQLGNGLSYRNLPLTVFGFSHCFREEIRPKNGLLRSREFILFDGYMLNEDTEAHEVAYEAVFSSMGKFLQILKIPFYPIMFQTGREEKLSHEFVVEFEHIGEKRILACSSCGSRYRYPQFQVCPCGGLSPATRGVEFADIVRNGTSYSKVMGQSFSGRDGIAHPFFSLSFGIGISKLVGVIVEASAKCENFVWPAPISPFDFGIIRAEGGEQAEHKLLAESWITQLDILIDERDLTVGRMLKEVEMMGLSVIVIAHKDGRYEFIDRTTNETSIYGSVSELRQKMCNVLSAQIVK